MVTVLEIDEDATAYRKQMDAAYSLLRSDIEQARLQWFAALVANVKDYNLQQAIFTAP